MSYSACAAETWTLCGDCALSLLLAPLAVQSYEQALVHDPSNVKALCGISAGLRLLDISRNQTVGSQTAIDNLSRAVATYPHLAKLAEMFRHLAECYLLIGLNDQAHQAVQAALELSPESPTLWLLNAQTLIRSNARQHATAALTHCLMLLQKSQGSGHDDVETARAAHAELAAIAAADGNVEASIAELTATLALPPPPLAQTEEYIALWCALATAKERASDVDGAVEVCEAAERAVGRNGRILLTHAYLLLERGQQEMVVQAVGLLHEIVDAEERENSKQNNANDSNNSKSNNPNTDPNSNNVNSNSNGSATDNSNNNNNSNPNSTGSSSASSPSPASSPFSPVADFLPYFLLGQAYSLLDQPRPAYDAYQVALRRAANSPIAWLAVGKLYLKLKQLPDALAAYSQALRLQMDDASAGAAAAWDGLSCVYERCDFQLTDAADACDRCAACYRAIGDLDGAQFFEQRAKLLVQALRKEATVPALREPVDVPSFLIRDLVALLPAERVAYVRGEREHHGQEAQRQEEQDEGNKQALQHRQQLQPPNPAHPQNSVPHPQNSMPPQPSHPSQQPSNSVPLPPHPMLLRPGHFSPGSGPARMQGSPSQLPPPPSWSPSQPPGVLRGPPAMLPPGVMQGLPVAQQQMIQGYSASPPNGMQPPPPPPGYAYGQYMPVPAMVGMSYPQPVNGWMR